MNYNSTSKEAIKTLPFHPYWVCYPLIVAGINELATILQTCKMTSLIIKHFKTIHLILFAISIGGIILCFNDFLKLGAILILLSSGLDNMLRFSCKSEPNLIAGNIKGFDYLLKMIFKDNFNQIYNLYTGIIFLLIGLILLVATFIMPIK